MADPTKKSKTAAEIKAQKKYMEKFCEIKVRMTKEERELVQAYAQSLGLSTCNFIKNAISHSSGILFDNKKENE